MAIVLFLLAGFLIGGTIQLVKSGATKFSIGLVGALALLAAAGGVAWLLPGDS
ncbi:hypothetical protein [Mangrovihabitans endophyticus]|uniref:Uncharacterized protein n=1 Tax=Mangrovihabitans endophyticus TaxID=1751298 RepID=A0A8J3BR69_9ACTN|nr:hypothetical protein [Mangrovihabitans endophyticus]GGK70741.1 hypothetical protein GCM10012284_00760 [Mangrovihabitans endophyticus]